MQAETGSGRARAGTGGARGRGVHVARRQGPGQWSGSCPASVVGQGGSLQRLHPEAKAASGVLLAVALGCDVGAVAGSGAPDWFSGPLRFF